MLNLWNLRFSRTRYIVAGMLLLALLAAAPFVGAVGASSAASLSGDDAYDPAAGGSPVLPLVKARASYSGDDAYDPAAGRSPVLALVKARASYSGDDAYDPAADDAFGLAAGGTDTRSTDAIACDTATPALAGGYSGDDAYDPAAGGNPDGASIALACVLDGSSDLN